MNKSLLVILGNQLFPIAEIKKINPSAVFMAEDFDLCSETKHHKLKILMFLGAMRAYRQELENHKIKVHYFAIDDDQFTQSYEEKLMTIIKVHDVSELDYFEIEDHAFEKRFDSLKKQLKIPCIEHQSPMFLCSREKFSLFSQQKKSLRMASFYQLMRRDMGILLDDSAKPVGGKWSYDEDNRKKLPRDIALPEIPLSNNYPELDSLKKNINTHFKDHPGSMSNIWMPLNREGALVWLDKFFKHKFSNFGPYEDALCKENNFLFHSALSPMMNLGLITPNEVIKKTIDYHEEHRIPLNSLEGFIRQIIGWREFIRGVYHYKGEEQRVSNFWEHKRKLTKHWYQGTTGITPLDDIIHSCLDYGYSHHIPRLMIVANIMTLARIDPREIYNWFMEMFVDSSDWVMVPNVFGMGSFADGGIFATKPYLCGSNYILKMSNYKKDSWCEVLDGLYWKFINDNRDFFLKQPRLAMTSRTLDRINPERKRVIFKKAEHFIETTTFKN